MTMHEGHRRRMRERFRQEGLDGFAPHEVLELLLFYTRPRGDTNPLAHRLLDAFGSLKGVLEAPAEQIMALDGVGEETATLLSLMVAIFRRYEGCICEETKQINHLRDAVAYCNALMYGLRKERFCVVTLSTQMKVLGSRVISEGSLTGVNAYPRAVAETAMSHNAYAVILCHNHPGGEPEPSKCDVDTTIAIQKALSALGIGLIDHLIVADGRVYSMVMNEDIRTQFGPSKGYPMAQDEQAWMGEWI